MRAGGNAPRFNTTDVSFLPTGGTACSTHEYAKTLLNWITILIHSVQLNAYSRFEHDACVATDLDRHSLHV